MPEPRRPLNPDPTERVKFDTPLPAKKTPKKKKKYPNKKKLQSEKNPNKVAGGKKAWLTRLKKPLKDAWFTDSRTED